MDREEEIQRSSESKRVAAGRKGKLGGHKFERAFALFHGGEIKGGSRTKVDVILPDGRGKISLKNPTKNHTQISLYSPRSWKSHFGITGAAEAFIDLFFGQPELGELQKTARDWGVDFEGLDPTQEIQRQRLMGSSLPAEVLNSGLNWFNAEAAGIFDALFVSGLRNFDGEVNYLAWAWQKDDLDSVKLYDLAKIRPYFIRNARWVLSPRQTTLWCFLGDRKVIHLQMKGSGKPGWGYHSMMFHSYDALFGIVESWDVTRDIL